MAHTASRAADPGRTAHPPWAKWVLLGLAALFLIAAAAAASAGPQAAGTRIKLSGRVMGSDGRPVSGLQILLFPMVKGQPAPGRDDGPITTGSDGRFTVTTRKAPSYYVLCEGNAGYRQAYATLNRTGTSLPTLKMTRRTLTGPAYAGCVGRAEGTRLQDPSCFCLDASENLLVADEAAKLVRVVSQDDRLVAKWPLEFAPQSIEMREDGSVLVAGAGTVAVLDGSGKAVATGKVPGGEVTAVTHLGDEVFVCASGGDGFVVYRYGRDLATHKKIISGLSGCCGQMDVRGRDGVLYVAENGRFSIVKYDRDGKKLGAFTHSERNDPAYFGDGCCEPKNLCFGPDGTIYAAASSPMLVKRYSPAGKYLGVAGKVPDADGSCVRVTIALTRSGKLYMLDTDNKLVRLLRPAATAKRD